MLTPEGTARQKEEEKEEDEEVKRREVTSVPDDGSW